MAHSRWKNTRWKSSEGRWASKRRGFLLLFLPSFFLPYHFVWCSFPHQQGRRGKQQIQISSSSLRTWRIPQHLYVSIFFLASLSYILSSSFYVPFLNRLLSPYHVVVVISMLDQLLAILQQKRSHFVCSKSLWLVKPSFFSLPLGSFFSFPLSFLSSSHFLLSS